MRLKNDIHASTYIIGYPMLTLYIADVERDVGMKSLSRKEAAKVLEDMKVKIEIPKAAVTQWERNTALDMAIEMLRYSEVPNSSDCISRQAAIGALCSECQGGCVPCKYYPCNEVKAINTLPSEQPEWNNHTVACLLAELFDDTCACNYNDIDEWLPEKCEVSDACPNPVGVACWEQYLKHRPERRTDEQNR
jgi:hypothetical protein